MSETGQDITEETSGFTRDLTDEMERVEPMPVQGGFSNLHEMYVSPSGHTCLYSATRYGKRYVLKCLKPDFRFTPVYRQALVKEFEIGLQLDHPYICRTIGMEPVQDIGMAVVLEYVDGCTLKELMQAGKLTAPLARRIARQLADALEYIHNKQIIHRDLKPSNIMVTHNGQHVRLIDFGLSDSDSFNVLKCSAGTPGYIAPEQLQPDARSDVRADVYSFGMVLKDMAACTSSRRLKAMAAACARDAVSERPSSMAEVFAVPRAAALQRVRLVLLVGVAAALACFVALSLHHRLAPAGDAVPADSVETYADGNRVMDLSQWPAADSIR